MFTGLPASGKSYVREKLVKAVQQHIASTYNDMCDLDPINEHELAAYNYCMKFRIVQASSDDVLDMIAAQQGKGYSEIFDTYKSFANDAFWHRLRLAVACRTPLILVDRTFVSGKARKDVIKTVKQEEAFAGASYRFMVIDVATPPAPVWNERLANRPGKIIPQEVLDDMAARQTSPEIDGFKYDLIVSVSGPGEVDDAVKYAKRTIMNVPEFA